MAFYTIAEARAAGSRIRPLQKSASKYLDEAVASVTDTDRFDVFLSHCLDDAEAIAGVKAILEEQGKRVYVDWIVDKQLDRTRVTPATANVLRKRMRASDSLIFATSQSSPNSKWMPWELGYFDGFHPGRIAVLPLVGNPGGGFQGQEYLGLYPVVEKLLTNNMGERAFITKGSGASAYLDLDDFQRGETRFKSV